MIIEYINKEEGNISCQVNEINENSIMHIIYSLSGHTEPQMSKNWNFYVSRNEVEYMLKVWAFNTIDSSVVKLGKFIHPAIGTVNFIIIPTFENMSEMNEHYKKEHLKHVENVKRLDPTAEYDEETELFKL